MKRGTTRYDAEFKQRAVKLALSSSQSILKTANELGVNPNTLYRWISLANIKQESPPAGSPQNFDLQAELMRLRKENVRLQEEREILKKAATYFAQQSK